MASLSPREVLIRTYHLLLNYGEMLGFGRRPGETPLEFARSLALQNDAERALQELTWGYAGAVYAGPTAPLPPVEAIRTAWSEVSAALTGRFSPEELALRRTTYLRQSANVSAA